MAEKKSKTYKLLRGVNYPKSKALRDRIRAGEATSEEAKDWERAEVGKGRKLPDDVASDLLARGVAEKED